MAHQRCDGCDVDVHIAGGIAGIWSLSNEPTGGLALTFSDGSEHFLCFDCVEKLPDDPEARDVGSLPDAPDRSL